jgi:hypothetical protein
MNAFAKDIRNLIAQRLAVAADDDVIRLVAALCANDPVVENEAAYAVAASSRYTKIDAAGRPVAPSASDWVAVADAQTGLTWTRKVLDCGEVDHADAMKAAGAVRLFGATDWRAPTIQEQLSIIDYERFDPALDTTYFDGPAGWTWTSTLAKSPSDYAWSVDLTDGVSLRNPQSAHLRVRAVRASQQLVLGV